MTVMRNILALLAAAFVALAPATAPAQFAEQQSYVVGTGTANAPAASFPNANTLADLIGVPLKVLINTTNTSAAQLTVNSFSATNIYKATSGGLGLLTGGELQAGQVAMFIYDGTQFELVSASNNAGVNQGCQFYNLKIVNDSGTPNTSIDITVDGATLIVPATRQGVFVGSQSLVLNTTTGTSTSTANGMDGEARGNNNAVFLYAIFNGTTFAGLGSLSATAPTLVERAAPACDSVAEVERAVTARPRA